MPIREDFQRARSEREKAARRVEIMDAAVVMLREAGNERFALSALADRVGVSKSTVFLYFANKDELLLTLYTRAGAEFFARFRKQLYRGMTGRAFCEAFVDAALADPTMLTLRASLANTIERAVSQSSLILAKQDIIRNGQAMAEHADELLGLAPGRGRIMLQALTNLLAGATQVDVGGYVDLETMPDDVARLIRSGNRRAAFLDGAEFIFTGATGLPFD